MKIPIVSIIGKPNVGKSTFFNRLVGSRIAITTDIAGTTRDRIFHKVQHPEMDFFLVDTGGLEFEKVANQDIEGDMQKQARIAIEESDLIIFMVNSKEEFSSDDYKAAEILRKTSNKKPVLLVANKCDRPLTSAELAHMFQLGLSEAIPISALHNTGIDGLMTQILKQLKDRHFLTKGDEQYKQAMDEEEKRLNIALVGKPNVGKSSIINALLNQDKLIVSDVAGTTRDSTDSIVKYEGKEYNFIDTAGLKRSGKVGRGIDKFSVLRTLSSIDRCDVALLVIDSSQSISHQDQQIANTILNSYKGLVILANKFDIKEEDEEDEKKRAKLLRQLQHKFPFLHWAPVIFTSAVTKKNLSKVFEQVEMIAEERKKRISTAKFNHFIENAIEQHQPTGTKRIAPKVFYATQAGINPPEFVFFVNKKKYFHFSYLRYLENRIREAFGYLGTPIKIDYKEKEQRFGKKK